MDIRATEMQKAREVTAMERRARNLIVLLGLAAMEPGGVQASAP